jgi:hypothetical protein
VKKKYREFFTPVTIAVTVTVTITQWASFSKKLQKLIILAPMHIFSFPIQGKGKIAREIRIWTVKFRKNLFSGSNRPFCGFDHFDQPH